jgi:hypothetical protein
MKARVTKTETKFQPIELTITIENENDFKWYSELFNITKGGLCEIDNVFRGLQDPDVNGVLNEMLVNIKNRK